jgi:chemotaxis protein CheY-P-specific phosphatase CheC/ActR/RegA family two-component response regulator
MPLPVIICDDSSFARKQVARALPPGWDVDLTYATGGREAIEAIRAGKGDVIFLDLTMPEMDGFDVLEFIRREDLPTLPIVISGDIQPESREQVMALGAVAFIKKPVDARELVTLLDQYGVLGLVTTKEIAFDGKVAFSEWCQEVANVAMGRAADLLAKVINEKVELSIPRVTLMEPAELEMVLATSTSSEYFSAISQGFIGGGIAGENLLLFHDADITQIARLMQFEGELEERDEIELYMDIANILVGAFLRGLAEQLDISFSQGHPHISLHEHGSAFLESHHVNAREHILTIEIGYILGQDLVHCDQMVLITAASIGSLKQRSGEVFE